MFHNLLPSEQEGLALWCFVKCKARWQGLHIMLYLIGEVHEIVMWEYKWRLQIPVRNIIILSCWSICDENSFLIMCGEAFPTRDWNRGDAWCCAPSVIAENWLKCSCILLMGYVERTRRHLKLYNCHRLED